jgi:hypothetical protein
MKFYDAWGSDHTYPHIAVGWTWAFDTPFSWTKQIASHWGGVRQGMAIAWPGHITDKGGIRNQFCHMIDVVPTILEATGIRAPDTVDGIPPGDDMRAAAATYRELALKHLSKERGRGFYSREANETRRRQGQPAGCPCCYRLFGGVIVARHRMQLLNVRRRQLRSIDGQCQLVQLAVEAKWNW